MQKYYHYGCQDFNDAGFGCTYRNLQTLMYWLNIPVPHITTLLEYFFKNYATIIENKQTRKLWIEPYDVGNYLKSMYDINGTNLLYIVRDTDIEMMSRTDISVYLDSTDSPRIYTNNTFSKLFEYLVGYFSKTSVPIIIDDGIFSYCLTGINETTICIADPHKFNQNDTNYSKNIDFFKNKFWMIYIPHSI